MTATSRIVLIAGIAGLAATIGLLWLTDVPLGVPGEWTWPRMPFSAANVWSWIVAAVAAAVYIGFVAAGGAGIESRGRLARAAWVTALAVAGFVWLGVVQSAVPGIAGLTKTHFVLYFPRSSGYFYQARYEVQDTREFLAGYEDLLAQRDYLHIGTHPPGLTLLFRGLLGLLAASPGLTDAVLATEPELTREAATTIRVNEQSSGRAFTRTDEACLWLAALLAQGAAAATVIPLFVLLAGCVDRRTAWFAAALWPLVPGIAIFLPKSDAVFPLISVLGPCLWLSGWQKRSLVLCGFAGLTLLTGMLLSLAIAPIAVLTALTTVLEMGWHAPKQREGRGQTTESLPSPPAAPPRSQRINLRWWLLSGSAAAVGFFVPVLLLWWACDLNLPRVWSWNVANHALFYEHNPRTWWKWLLVNPVELALAAGGPLALIAFFGGVRSRGTRLFPLVAATALVWGLLWISGKNMGEAARLWLLFQPWLVVAAAGALACPRTVGFSPSEQLAASGGVQPRRLFALTALLAMQAVACIATVTRVDGFQFDQM